MVDQSTLITGVAALVGAGIVVRRTLRPQTVRVWALIAVPLILLAAAVLAIAAAPPASAAGIGIIGAGALAGAGVGYARARHSSVTLGPRPGTLVVAGNNVLVALLLAAFAIRLIARAAFGGHGPLAAAVTDAFIVFAAVMLAVARGSLFFTWRRLRAAPPGAAGTS